MNLTPYQEYLLDGLTEQQKEVVSAPAEQSQLVLAGAGTGKTTCLTKRLVWLSTQGVYLPNITALTFTNRAAREMSERVCRLLGADPHEKDIPLPNMGTFHSVAAKILRSFAKPLTDILDEKRLTKNFTILDEDGSNSLLRQASIAHGPEGAKWKVEKGHLRILALEMERLSAKEPWDDRLIEDMERHGVTIDLIQTGIKNTAQKIQKVEAASIIRTYHNMKAEQNLLDYDDLIRLCCILLENFPDASQNIEMVLCDEYQDTSTMQERLLQGLRRGKKSVSPLTAVGDNDQLIYRWRNAELENILRLTDRCPEVHQRSLTLNFRSTPEILDTANASLGKNELRFEKTLVCADGRKSTGNKNLVPVIEYSDAHTEAQSIVAEIEREISNGRDLEQIGVLVRKSLDLSLLDAELSRLRIPYRVIAGRRFTERMEVRIIVAWIRILLNPGDNEAAERILTNPKRHVGAVSLRELAKMGGMGMIANIPRAIDSGILNKPAAKGAARVYEIYNRLLQLAENYPLNLGSFCENIMDISEIRPTLLEKQLELEDVDKDAANQITKKLEHMKSIIEIAEKQEGNLATLLESLSISDIQPDENKTGMVTLATIHGAKGAEWEWVHILAFEQGTLPVLHSDYAIDEKQKQEMLEEERRLLHVACTRAKQHLSLSYSRYRRSFPREPSIFMDEVQNTLSIHQNEFPIQLPEENPDDLDDHVEKGIQLEKENDHE